MDDCNEDKAENEVNKTINAVETANTLSKIRFLSLIKAMFRT